MSTTPRPTSWMSTSATCAASSAVPETRRRYHGALGRLPPRQPRLIDAVRSSAFPWAALAPCRVGHAGRWCARDRLRRCLPWHRHPAAPPDRPGDLRRCGGVRREPRARQLELAQAWPKRPALRARPALRRQLDAPVRDRPGGGTSTNRPELLGRATADQGETQAQQEQENRLAARLLTVGEGFSTVVFPTWATCGCSRGSCASGGRAGDGRGGEPLAPVAHAQRGVARTFILAGYSRFWAPCSGPI